ncbi:MAG: DEAD/DEAH box helicase, partial [Thermotogota bacterium]
MNKIYAHPEKTIKEIINFNAEEKFINTRENEKSIFELQEMGSAKLWNLLTDYKTALLADEVGMGKTYQALAVCCLQWIVKPDSKILVLTPNRTIASNWKSEYFHFIKRHYKRNDNIVKTVLTNGPVHDPCLFKKDDDLIEKSNQGTHNFFIGSIYFFSNPSKKITEKEETDFEATGKNIREKTGKFDLIIIDEAHYFRNTNNSSNRSKTAKGFFGRTDSCGSENKPADKILLLTATPNYSRTDDIKNLIELFSPELFLKPFEIKKDSNSILYKIAVRRLKRILNKNKYEYRKDHAKRISFSESDDVTGELFFALYQQNLAERRSLSGRSFMHGYLEGLESVDIEEKKTDNEVQNEDSDIREKDFEDSEKVNDHKILTTLVKGFKDHFQKSSVTHPKIDSIVRDISRASLNPPFEKSLIFVRRIPSVKEISGKINNKADEFLWEKIKKAWEEIENLNFRGINSDNLTRVEYQNKINENFDLENEETGDTGETEAEDSEVNSFSAVLKLFRAKNKTDSEDINTHASNFRRRFFQETSLYSIFFEPAADYKDKGYKKFYKQKKNSNKNIYKKSAQTERLFVNKEDIKEEDQNDRQLIFDSIVSSIIPDTDLYENESEYPTVFTVLYKKAPAKIQKVYDDFNIYEKESFSIFFKKGILFASSILVDLYSVFIRLGTDNSYSKFFNYLTSCEQIISDFSRLFNKSLENYRIFYSKTMGINDNKALIRENWNIFNKMSPALFCSGNVSSRERIIKSFNSVFYPNAVIATSVLQEGVNMHLNCKNVVHYGIPANAGTAEQRAGRVDRHGCLAEKNMINGEDSEISCIFPYLSKTFDQDQLSDFLFKYNDARKLIDKCRIDEFRSEVSSPGICSLNPESILEKLIYDTIDDPYPVESSDFSNDLQLLNLNRIVAEGRYTLDKLFSKTGIKLTDAGKDRGNVLWFKDFKIYYGNGEIRRQPVYAEINFISEISSSNFQVYCISLKTPLSREGDWGNILLDTDNSGSVDFDDLYFTYCLKQKKRKMVKFCKDPDLNSESYFKYYLRTDLPLIIENGENKSLDPEEIEAAYSELVSCADKVEKEAFIDQDLS